MKTLVLLLVCVAALSGFSVARAQTITWEKVGDTEGSFFRAADWAPDGRLWAAGRFGVQTLNPPYDSLQTWVTLENLYGGDPVLTLSQDTVVLGHASRGIVRTTDGGLSFTEIAFEGGGTGAPVAIPYGLPYGGTLVMPGRANAEGGRFGAYSRDRGATWTNSTMPGHPGEYPYAYALFIVERGPHAGRIVLVGQWGLAVSDDGGATYTAVPNWWQHFRFGSGGGSGSLAGAAPGGNDRLVAGIYDVTDGTGSAFVAVSDDGGETWRRTADLPGDPNSQVSAFVDFGGGRGLILMGGGHVWQTVDAGETWQRLDTVVPGAQLDPDDPRPSGRVLWGRLGPDSRLYVGGTALTPGSESQWGWMWRTTEPFAVASSEVPESPSSGLSLTVRPNPATGAVTVAVASSSARDAVTIDILDALGRRVAAVHAGPLGAGERTFALDASAWAPGVYTARAQAGGEAQTARFTVAR